MSRSIERLAAGLVALWLSGPITSARADVSLHLAVGQTGSITYQLGVGLSSLIKTVLLPSDGINLTIVETIAEGQAPLLLVADQAQLALVSMPKATSTSSSGNLRRILTFWSDEQQDEPPIELLVRADVPNDVVYRISKTILDNGEFLSRHNERSWDFSTDRALTGSHLPFHQGAFRYYSEQGVPDLAAETEQRKSSSPPLAGTRSAQASGNATFFVYFDRGQVELDETAKLHVAAACKYADSSRAGYIRVVGYASSPEEDGAKGDLAVQRAVSVSTALGNDDRCQGLIEIVGSTEVKSSLPDGLSAGSNDRVEVTVMPVR